MDQLHQLLRANRLGEVGVHSAINTAFPISQKRMSRHRDDGKALSRVTRLQKRGIRRRLDLSNQYLGFVVADFLGGFKALPQLRRDDF